MSAMQRIVHVRHFASLEIICLFGPVLSKAGAGRMATSRRRIQRLVDVVVGARSR
jgi:hypothetical protein